MRKTDAHRIVLSVEDFSSPGYRSQASVRLAEFVEREGFDARIVGYVRPQWQLLESEYSRRVGGGGMGASFARFAKDMLLVGENTILDYNLAFAPFRELFGERLRVFPLEPAALPNGLLAHFLSQIGAPAHLSNGLAERRAHVRLGARELEVLRVLRARLPHALPLSRFPRIGLRGATGDDAPFAAYSVEEICGLEAHFADANRRFATDYGIDTSGTLFRASDSEAGRRPNIAHWELLNEEERRRVRDYVRRAIGFDLDGRVGLQAAYLLRNWRLVLVWYARRAVRSLRSIVLALTRKRTTG